MRAEWASDVGRVRELNEDRVLVEGAMGLLVVADGMGGHAGGEVASALAVDALVDCLRKASPGGEPGGADAPAPTDRLISAIEQADRLIRARAEADPDLTGMGTTVVAALAGVRDVGIAHVGDSRAYLLQRGALRQLTRDHTLVADMVDSGEITATQAKTHHLRNYLSRSVGNGLGQVKVDVQLVTWSADDRLLLCSDGLVGMIDDAHIQSVLVKAGTDLGRACRSLVRAANQAGGKDNISVIVACPG